MKGEAIHLRPLTYGEILVKEHRRKQRSSFMWQHDLFFNTRERKKNIAIDFCSVCLKTLCETIADHKVHCVHPDKEALVTHSSYKFQFLRPFVPVYHFLKEGKPSSVHMLSKTLCTHHVQIKGETRLVLEPAMYSSMVIHVVLLCTH